MNCGVGSVQSRQRNLFQWDDSCSFTSHCDCQYQYYVTKKNRTTCKYIPTCKYIQLVDTQTIVLLPNYGTALCKSKVSAQANHDVCPNTRTSCHSISMQQVPQAIRLQKLIAIYLVIYQGLRFGAIINPINPILIINYRLIEMSFNNPPPNPQGFRTCATSPHPSPANPHTLPTTRFTYRLASYNTLEKFYTQQPTKLEEGTREQPIAVCPDKIAFRQTKNNIFTSITPDTQFDNSCGKPKRPIDSQPEERTSRQERQVRPAGLKNKEERMRRQDVLKVENSERPGIGYIYEQEQESFSTLTKKVKVESTPKKLGNKSIQEESENLHERYDEMQSMRLHQSSHTHNPQHSKKLVQSRVSLAESKKIEKEEAAKKCSNSNKRLEISRRYQSPEDSNKKLLNDIKNYKLLMEDEINSILEGQDVENFIKHYLSHSSKSKPSVRPRQVRPKHSQSYHQEKRQKQNEKEEGGVEEMKQEQKLDEQKHEQTPKAKTDLNRHQPNLIVIPTFSRVGSAEDQKGAMVDAIFDCEGHQFCYSDNQEEQELFELNQFLLN